MLEAAIAHDKFRILLVMDNISAINLVENSLEANIFESNEFQSAVEKNCKRITDLKAQFKLLYIAWQKSHIDSLQYSILKLVNDQTDYICILKLNELFLLLGQRSK